jgi:hypothetical protein
LRVRCICRGEGNASLKLPVIEAHQVGSSFAAVNGEGDSLVEKRDIGSIIRVICVLLTRQPKSDNMALLMDGTHDQPAEILLVSD